MKNKIINKILKDLKLDAILVYGDSRDFRFYKFLTGIEPLTIAFVLLEQNKTSLIQFSYLVEDTKSKSNFDVISIRDDRTLKEDLAKILVRFQKVGVVGDVPFRVLSENLNFIDVTKEFEVLISYKSSKDVKGIEDSAKTLSNIFSKLEKEFKSGMRNEKDIEKFVKREIFEKGLKELFPVSICSDELLKNSTIGSARDIDVKKYVCIDAGVIKNGYTADMTRMFFVRDSFVSKSYELLKKVNSSIEKKVCGISVSELRNIYLKELKKIGLPDKLNDEYIGHGTGFSLHEFPVFFQEESKDFIFKSGNVFTLEPEIKLKNGINIRVEDMYAIDTNNDIIKLTF